MADAACRGDRFECRRGASGIAGVRGGSQFSGCVLPLLGPFDCVFRVVLAPEFDHVLVNNADSLGILNHLRPGLLFRLADGGSGFSNDCIQSVISGYCSAIAPTAHVMSTMRAIFGHFICNISISSANAAIRARTGPHYNQGKT